ncbi:MAG: methylated-DNA--[protein]-cysteine S-methyltransferase [Limisphaerales bacterium]
MKNYFWELPVSTRIGRFVARYSEKGLAELNFPPAGRVSSRAVSRRKRGDGSQFSPSEIRNPKSEIVSASSRRLLQTKIRSWHRATGAALNAVLAGRAAKTLPPLDWSGKTEFQKSVWNALRKIPAGKTKSYGEIAQALGKPKAARAVGGACGANLIPVLVPCHRVLAANGKIGGFSGGLNRKRDLLAREGVSPWQPQSGDRK